MPQKSLPSSTDGIHDAMHPKYPQKTEEDNQENRAQGKETKINQ